MCRWQQGMERACCSFAVDQLCAKVDWTCMDALFGPFVFPAASQSALWHQVLWELAQQTSAANNENANTRSNSSLRASADSPLLARGTGPGRPIPNASAEGLPPHSSESLLHSIHAAIHRTANSSSVGSSSQLQGVTPGSATPPSGSAESSARGLLQHEGAGGSHEGTDRELERAPLCLPSLPWSDWEIREGDVDICRRPDGSDWELGGGAFGKVMHTHMHARTLIHIRARTCSPLVCMS